MGTRSIVRFKERHGEKVTEFCAVYGQFDGYLNAMGEDLCTFLDSGKMVNGYQNNGKEFNGMGCLAAQWISERKDSVGGIYLQAPGCDEEECNYEVEGGYGKAEGWNMAILPLVVRYKAYGDSFEGSVEEFRAFIDAKAAAEDE